MDVWPFILVKVDLLNFNVLDMCWIEGVLRPELELCDLLNTIDNQLQK